MQNKNRSQINIVVVDTSPVDRDLIKKALEDAGDIDVVSVATEGKVGRIKILELKPDIVLLDMGIKDLSPVQFIQESKKSLSHLGFIATTANSPRQEIIQNTIDSLESGVFDFIEKPPFTTELECIGILKRKLLPKIRSLSIQRYSRIAKADTGAYKKPEKIFKNLNDKETAKPEAADITTGKNVSKFQVVAIGVSTGGPEALSNLIPEIPSDFPLPIMIVLHMPKNFTGIMAASLNKKSKLTVKEAAAGEVPKPGFVYLSEGGRHLVVRKNSKAACSLDYYDGPEENGCKPSVDVLFRSISECYGENTLAVILTGMGEDGVKSTGILKEMGALTIAQDKETSVVWGMPGSAVKAGFIDEVLPLDKIAYRILELCYHG